MIHHLSKWVLVLGSVLLLCSHFTLVRAETLDDVPVAREIERRFNGLFLFATEGQGEHRIFHRIENASEADRGDTVVCMVRECLLEIARVPDAVLQGRGSPEKIRRCFGVLRDAYHAMRGATAEERPSALRRWREVAAHVGHCLEDGSKG